MSNASKSGELITTCESFALLISMVASGALIGCILWYSGSGYDFSDEGHYLNWIARPWTNQTSVTQFSFVYHPLYQLVGEDVALLRRSSILLTLSLGWLLCHLLVRRVVSMPDSAGWRRNLPTTGIAASLSTATLSSLHTAWLPTPSYDSLTLQALLLAGSGVLLADAKAAHQRITGWMLIGFSGWLSFMAKPTSALALGATTGIYLLVARKMNWRMLGLAVTVAALLGLASAWLIDGSVEDFVVRLKIGAEDAKLLQGGHTLGEAFRLDKFSLSPAECGVLSTATLLVFLSTSLSFSTQPAKRLGASIITFLFSCSLLVAVFGGGVKIAPGPFHGLQYWVIPFGALLTGLVMARHHLLHFILRDSWALVTFLAVVPWVYAFGTNSNYWAAESKAAIFWVLSGIAILGAIQPNGISWRMLLPAMASAQLCTGVLLVVSMEHPYRQTEPLRHQHSLMRFAGTGAELWVSRGFAEYVDKLQQLGAAGGFKTEMPVLDLTGHYPGAVYAMGAKSLGRSWLIGGYPGSNAMAMANLDRVPREDLTKAWILTEPAGLRRLSPEILERYGIDLLNDYTEVGTLDAPTGTYPETYRQHLWRPSK